MSLYTFAIFICATMYTKYFMDRVAQTVQRIDKGIPVIEKTRKQTFASETMRLQQLTKEQ